MLKLSDSNYSLQVICNLTRNMKQRKHQRKLQMDSEFQTTIFLIAGSLLVAPIIGNKKITIVNW
uniref:Uncharacterized protein n=1 Tax=Arundo donax TaxID=35708 RepID=A0A0A9AK63_ARUDO